MIIKFKGGVMPQYKGIDGRGNVITISDGETADVSDAVGKILCSQHSRHFSEVKSDSPVEKPSKSDKKQRKVQSFQVK